MKRYSPELLAYGASKGAVGAMGTSIAGYCRQMRYPVHCNTIYPGGIDIPIVAERIAELEPAQRPDLTEILGKPEEYANMIVFLASDGLLYLKDTNMIVDRAAIVDLME